MLGKLCVRDSCMDSGVDYDIGQVAGISVKAAHKSFSKVLYNVDFDNPVA